MKKNKSRGGFGVVFTIDVATDVLTCFFLYVPPTPPPFFCTDNQFRMSILERLEQMERRMAEMASHQQSSSAGSGGAGGGTGGGGSGGGGGGGGNNSQSQVKKEKKKYILQCMVKKVPYLLKSILLF